MRFKGSYLSFFFQGVICPLKINFLYCFINAIKIDCFGKYSGNNLLKYGFVLQVFYCQLSFVASLQFKTCNFYLYTPIWYINLSIDNCYRTSVLV